MSRHRSVTIVEAALLLQITPQDVRLLIETDAVFNLGPDPDSPIIGSELIIYMYENDYEDDAIRAAAVALKADPTP